MIYFDGTKQAYAHSIPDYIATTDDEVWAKYQGTDKWDIIDGQFQDITLTPAYLALQANKVIASLVEYNYELKAKVAYTGVLYDYNNQEVIFQTNEISAINTSTTARAFANDASYTEVPWKFWTTKEPVNYPVFITLSKEQFAAFDTFAQEMSAKAIEQEKLFTEKIMALKPAQLLDEAFIETFKASIATAYEAINIKIELV